jgi:DNA-binding CsgD family transcriptional regulator
MAACVSFDGVTRDILARLAAFFKAETASFRQVLNDSGTPELGHNGCLGVPQRNHEAYVQNYFLLDPIAQQSPPVGSTAKSDVFTLAERLDFGQFTQSEYYNDFFRPIGIHHVMVLRISDGAAREDLLFGFHRPRRARPFGAEELARAQLVLGGLNSALGRLTAKERLNRSADVLDVLESYGPDPRIAVLDGTLRILYSSPGARACFGLDYRDERWRRLRDACVRAHRDSAQTAEVRLGDTEPTALLHRRPLADGGVRFVAIAARPRADVPALHAELTAREREVALLAAQGLANRQTAARLNIAVRTVENHLRAIYEKLGVCNRVQLARRLGLAMGEDDASNARC